MSDYVNEKEYTYVYNTWPEMNEQIGKGKVVLLPVGSVEDHGPHMPLDCDFFLSKSVCEAAAKARPDLFLILPPVAYGFELHHMDWPGTIHISCDSFMNYVLDITKSLAHHGFKKIVILNGHGSNMSLLDIVARKTVLETDAHCCALAWFSLVKDAIAKVRETPFPGSAHADELETSVYMYLAPERLSMDKAAKEIPKDMQKRKYIYMDIEKKAQAGFMDWWTRFNKSGVIGDPTLATMEKGKLLFETAVKNLIEMSEEFKAMPINERVDYHTNGAGKANLEP